MKDGPNIVGVASLVGDNTRADVLTALLADRALTATELAGIAGVTKQTISGHLAKLVGARLVAVEKQGRHRYFRLADEDVAHLLESLMGVAFRTGAVRLRSSPREPALRRARVCYDHLAGELGVVAYDGLITMRVIETANGVPDVSKAGSIWFGEFGIDTLALRDARRSFCRSCLDWGERRHHLAGALGAALLLRILNLGWAKRVRDSRVIAFTGHGEAQFLEVFGRQAQRGA
jgi:DNA-binding transcriptional ArsR family regulator